MPLAIAVVVLSFLAGRLLRRAESAYVLSAALGVLLNVVCVWAVADGKGDDPWWWILVGIAAAAAGLGAARLGVRLRDRVAV